MQLPCADLQSVLLLDSAASAVPAPTKANPGSSLLGRAFLLTVERGF